MSASHTVPLTPPQVTVLALLLLCACAVRAQKPIATIGSETISTADLEAVVREHGKSNSFRRKLLTVTAEGRREILEAHIDRRVLYLAAVEERIVLDEEAERRLQRLEEELRIEAYVRRHVTDQPIPDDELRAYFEAHHEQFAAPERRKLRHIVVRDEATARGLAERLQTGEEFGRLAAEVNIDGTREREGRLGTVRRGVMVKEFDECAFALAAGEVGGPVATRFGYHLIQVEQIVPAREPAWEALRDEIAGRIRAERLRRLQQVLRGRFGVAVHPENIE